MKKALLLAIVSLPGVAAHAQTSDPNYRSWAYLVDFSAPRAAGMGGASVAVADDAAAVALNPAGMLTLKKTEIEGSILSRGSGTLPGGDATASRTSEGFIGGSAKVSQKWAVGAYIWEPHDLHLTLSQGGAAGSLDSGGLNSTVTDVGAAGAWQPTNHVMLGLRVNVTHMSLEGIVRHGATDGTGFDATTSAAQDRVAGDFGILIKASESPDVTIGAAFTQGARWNATRNAQSLAGVAQQPIEYQVSSPNVVRGGVSVRPTPRLLVTAEVDYAALSRLKDGFIVVPGTGSAGDYTIDDGVDFRAGAEYAIPAGSASVVARAGIYSATAAGFKAASASATSAFSGGERSTYETVGASLDTRTLRLDVAGAFGGFRSVVTAGVAVKF